jgi:predicted Zn-dependent protease
MSALSGEELVALGESALDQVHGGDAELFAVSEVHELTRFAENVIHQNVAERGLRMRARVIAEGRVGAADIRGGDAENAKRVIAAAEQARRLAAIENAAPLPAPDGGADSAVAYSERTVATTPEQRADLVAAIARAAVAKSLEAYGYVSTTVSSAGVVSSTGMRRHATSTQASAVVVVRGESGSGYAARHSADIDALGVDELAEEAVNACQRNQNAVALDPGVYEVVMAPYAVTDLVDHLSYTGFSALAKQEQRSFMRLGERLMSDSVSITDDSQSPDLFPYPFDAEGVSTQVVNLVDSGVCNAFVYDTPTAVREQRLSTGHSLPQPNTFGPFPRHMQMAAGDASLTELLAPVKRGLYVTRLWYVRDVHPLRTIITGMTRDGTFLIENGRIGRAVRDLRFTQSIIDALNDVRGLSAERRLELGEDGAAVLSPWAHLGHFAFTS